MVRIDRILSTLAVMGIASSLSQAGAAAVVNVDFAASASDATHVGADGVLSGSGTFWNGVLYNETSFDLRDENGALTNIDVIPTAPFGNGTDGNSTNDLQDSGLTGDGWSVDDIAVGESCALAASWNGQTLSTVSVQDANGVYDLFSLDFPTYLLPGTEGRDYGVLTGLEPFDLGTGKGGLRIFDVSGSIAGFQIECSSAALESTPALGPAGVAVLLLAFGAASWRMLRPRCSAR